MTTLFKVGFGFLLGFIIGVYGMIGTPADDAATWRFVANECSKVVEEQRAVIAAYLNPPKYVELPVKIAGRGGENAKTKKH